MVIKNGMDSREFLAERETSEVFVFTTGILKRSLKLINNNIENIKLIRFKYYCKQIVMT